MNTEYELENIRIREFENQMCKDITESQDIETVRKAGMALLNLIEFKMIKGNYQSKESKNT